MCFVYLFGHFEVIYLKRLSKVENFELFIWVVYGIFIITLIYLSIE